MNLKNNKNIFCDLNGKKVEKLAKTNSDGCILLKKKFNTCYYGEPCSYDWYNAKDESLGWGYTFIDVRPSTIKESESLKV